MRLKLRISATLSYIEHCQNYMFQQLLLVLGFWSIRTSSAHSDTDLLVTTFTTNLTQLCDLSSENVLPDDVLKRHIQNNIALLPTPLRTVLSDALQRGDDCGTLRKILDDRMPDPNAGAIISLSSVLWVTSIIALTIGLGGLFRPVFVALLTLISPLAWEILAHGMSLGLIYQGIQWGERLGEFTALTGSILESSMAMWRVQQSDKIRRAKYGGLQDGGDHLTALFTFIFVLHSTTAVVLSSQLHGIVAVMSLLATMGFFLAAHPAMEVFIGFTGPTALHRTMLVSILLLGAFATAYVQAKEHWLITPFQTGVFFGCTFAYCLGQTIVSNCWYMKSEERRKVSVLDYVFPQIVVLVTFSGLLFLGHRFELDSMRHVTGVFYVLWVLEKVVELPWEKVGVSGAMVIIGMAGWQLARWMTTEHAMRLLDLVIG